MCVGGGLGENIICRNPFLCGSRSLGNLSFFEIQEKVPMNDTFHLLFPPLLFTSLGNCPDNLG